MLDTLGTADVGFALCPTLTVGAIEAISQHGSETQRATYLPHLITGAWAGTMNLTEPQAGSDVGALKTAAVRRGDGAWSIKGSKIFISYGDHDLAENIVHLVLARTPGAPEGTRGISLFLVPKYRLNSEGKPESPNDVRSISIEHKLGLHASPTCVLSFGDNDDCIGELIGAEHGGMRAMFTMMNNARLNVGLQGVQVAEAATRRAAAYALERVQSVRADSKNKMPVRIAEHPDVRRMLIRMRAQTMASRALAYYAAGQVDRAGLGDAAAKLRVEILTPLVKAHCTDLACEVASLGIQIHGGMGFIEETGAAQHYRDARILPIYEGTNGIQAADLVGRKLGAGNGEGFVSLLREVNLDATAPQLRALAADCLRIGAQLSVASSDDRLAASVPFLTMAAVAVCGWLLEQVAAAAPEDALRQAATTFYTSQIVPEAQGLGAAATESAEVLYAVPAEAFVR